MLDDNIPGLFAALVEDPDEDSKWSVFTFPVDYDASTGSSHLHHNDRQQILLRMKIIN